MSIALAMLLFGAMIVYAGWNNVSIPAMLRGDNATPKGTA